MGLRCHHNVYKKMLETWEKVFVGTKVSSVQWQICKLRLEVGAEFVNLMIYWRYLLEIKYKWGRIVYL